MPGNRRTPLVLLLALATILLTDAAVVDARHRAVAADLAADLGVGQVMGRPVEVRAVRPRVPRPIALSISRLGISSSLIDLSKTRRGTLEVPKDYGQAGWYSGSARPGDLGPSVLVGHIDSRNGPGVFYRLGDLRHGDVVRITRADRSVASFRVTRMVQVAKSRFPTQAVYGSTGKAGLRLITCGGQFDRASGHYLSNTIVFASYVGARTPARPPSRPFLVRGSAPVRPLPARHVDPPAVRPTAKVPVVAPVRAPTYLRHRAR